MKFFAEMYESEKEVKLFYCNTSYNIKLKYHFLSATIEMVQRTKRNREGDNQAEK